MTDIDSAVESQANVLCKSCGLCCTGHLFIWAKLRPSELDPAEALGMKVFRSDPSQRGFSQPCPLWNGQCAIYDSPRYPHVCRTYKCKLLKDTLDENVSLPNALTLVEDAKKMIRELETLLADAPIVNFRESLVVRLERPREFARQENAELEFRLKAGALLIFYEKIFGVDDLVINSGQE